MAGKMDQIIVIADSDSDYLEWAAKHLSVKGIEVLTTSKSDEALKLFTEKAADLLVADFNLAPMNGLELLKKVRLNHPNSMVLLTGAISSTNVIIEAMKLGASDVLRKEALNFELRPAAERALQAAEQTKLAAEAQAESPIPAQQASTDLIIGRSPAMQDVYKLVGRVARADAPVLITGESGVGKEVVSNAVHQFSRRSNAEYVTINCAAIPSNLLESELFGHEKGAFTGAVGQRIGRFEQCDKGTLFLDEIGDMPMELQSKLLRVLQSGEYSRVGGNLTLQSDVRILAATNKTLEEEVKNGTFREDLFYRLNVFPIFMPPLRERTSDILLLADHFLEKYARQYNCEMRRISTPAIDMMMSYHWPGNVRELENCIERAVILSSDGVVHGHHMPPSLQTADATNTPVSGSFEALMKSYEREIIIEALKSTRGNMARAARILGTTTRIFSYRIQKLEIEPRQYRK